MPVPDRTASFQRQCLSEEWRRRPVTAREKSDYFLLRTPRPGFFLSYCSRASCNSFSSAGVSGTSKRGTSPSKLSIGSGPNLSRKPESTGQPFGSLSVASGGLLGSFEFMFEILQLRARVLHE